MRHLDLLVLLDLRLFLAVDVAVAVVAGPECQVVANELHDERRVLVLLFLQRVELTDGVIECGLGEGARLRGLVQDLKVENTVIEGEAKANGIRRGQALLLRNLRRLLVLILRLRLEGEVGG